MTAFHEYALYGFIEYMIELQEAYPDFENTYFDEDCRQRIKEAAQKDYDEMSQELEPDDEPFDLEDCEEKFYQLFWYEDDLFTDTDFTLIDGLYNLELSGQRDLIKMMGINLDYYYELLPLDIQKQYETSHITLSGEVSEFLHYIGNRMNHGNLYKLFWENELPVNESRVQLILENIMDAYFYQKNIDITREALLGNGKVDFKFYRNSNTPETVLIEVKLAKATNLKRGYEKQLTEYMYSSNCDDAFYLIACYTDEEYEKVLRFIRENIYTDTIQEYIKISILDLRIRKPASIS